MPAVEWIAVFEDLYGDLGHLEKKRELASYLAGDAMPWYANDVADNPIDWPKLRQRFLSRFGTACVSPVVLMIERRKRSNKSIHNYALDMNRLMSQALSPTAFLRATACS